jgi:hypothetical protein
LGWPPSPIAPRIAPRIAHDRLTAGFYVTTFGCYLRSDAVDCQRNHFRYLWVLVTRAPTGRAKSSLTLSRLFQLPGTLRQRLYRSSSVSRTAKDAGDTKKMYRSDFFSSNRELFIPFAHNTQACFQSNKLKSQHPKMMFSKFSLIVLVAIVALASATDYGYENTVSKTRPAVR